MIVSEKNILNEFYKLTHLEQVHLIKKLELLADEAVPAIDVLREDIIENEKIECPHCHSDQIIKWGSYNNQRQRYQCKGCHRTFTGLTGTAVHYIKKKNLWFKHLELMFDGAYRSIEVMAKKLGVSKQTAFDWRHKVLSALSNNFDNFKGITEMDDINIKYSQKGRKGLDYSKKRGGKKKGKRGDGGYNSKILVTADRDKNLDMNLVRIGRLKRKDIERAVGNKLSRKRNVITSDQHPSIIAFTKSRKMVHQTFKAKESHTKDKVYHVQYVNNVAQRFKSIVNDTFKGVSTKYLKNYANWFSIKEKIRVTGGKIANLFREVLLSNKAWSIFTNAEQDYENFIKTYSVRTYRCPIKRKWSSA